MHVRVQGDSGAGSGPLRSSQPEVRNSSTVQRPSSSPMGVPRTGIRPRETIAGTLRDFQCYSREDEIVFHN